MLPSHHWQPARSCLQAAGPGHPAAHSRKHETSGGSSWNLLTAPPTLALLVSLEQAGRQVVETTTKHFNSLRGKNPQAHLASPSTHRSVRHCLADGALQPLSSRIWNSSNLEGLLDRPFLNVGKPREQDCEDLGAVPHPKHYEGSMNVPLLALLYTEALLIQMIHCSRFWHNLIRWLLAGRTRVLTSSIIRLPARWGRWSYRIPSSLLPFITTLYQLCLITDADMTSNAGFFTLLA